MLMNLCADAGLVAFYWASEATPSHTSLISVSRKKYLVWCHVRGWERRTGKVLQHHKKVLTYTMVEDGKTTSAPFSLMDEI